jgi:5-carboxyvanillate decarboxylase
MAATGTPHKLRLIGTEETFSTPAYIDAYMKLAERDKSTGVQYVRLLLQHNAKWLTDLDYRLSEMDQSGVDMHLLSLNAPGVQVFEPEEASRLASVVNDEIAALIQKYPERLCGLAAVAPQDPVGAVKEIDRAMGQLGLNGIIINSHTQGEFLDDPKFFPILEAAVRNRAAIYLHPQLPPDSMIKPFEKYAMEGAIWGFAAEASLHAVRMILGGVFDRFPDLQIVLGHMGEGLPYWLFRLDQVYRLLTRLKSPAILPLRRLPSEYVKSNFYVTTSGMFWNPVLKFCVESLGVDRVMFSIDFPFERCQEAAEFMRNAPLSDEEKRKIAHENAQKLFRIKTPW